MKIKGFVSLLFAFCFINAAAVFGAQTTVTLNSAGLDSNNKSIEVSGKLENAVENQQLVLMATSLMSNGIYNVDEIFYINQTDANADKSGAFKASFNIAKLLDDDGVYIVRVGGTNIDTPVTMVITGIGDNDTVFLGDVNLDGRITAADASLTLQHVLYNLEYLTQRQVDAMMVSDSGIITSENAAQILAKALDDMYIFSVNR